MASVCLLLLFAGPGLVIIINPESKVHGVNMGPMLAPWSLLSGLNKVQPSGTTQTGESQCEGTSRHKHTAVLYMTVIYKFTVINSALFCYLCIGNISGICDMLFYSQIRPWAVGSQNGHRYLIITRVSSVVIFVSFGLNCAQMTFELWSWTTFGQSVYG